MHISTSLNLDELYLRINSSRFHYLKFILEGYDNLAVLSSFNSKEGVVRLKVSPESYQELIELLSELSPRLSKPLFKDI